MEAMSSACGLEIEQKRVASICSKEELQEIRKVDELKSAKAEMGEVKEENERLKMMLERVEKDYHSLQLRFFDILHKESSKKEISESAAISNNDETEEPEFVSLCLGRTTRKDPKNDGRIVGKCSKPKENEHLEAVLTLGLNSECRLSMMEMESDLSTVKGSEEQKEAESGGKWPTHKSMKAKIGDDHETSDQMPTKRARVSVRARCDTPMMIDGCQWRKYGQKIAKGNPCPRAYYRCTVAPACPVRKQVQRCAEDMSILITTYEGTHNHPLPVSATAMASTTSAAASMLLSGSSASQPPSQNYASCGNTPAILNGMNFTHFDQSRAKHSFFPNPTSALFPTITLDLTSSSSSTSHINHLPSGFASIPRFPTTNLNFCLSNSHIQPTFWGNEFPNHSTMPTEKTKHMRPISMRNEFQEHIYQRHMKNQAPSREVLAETLTKAISTDPSLRTVIAAAVSSIVGQGSSNGNQGGEDTSGSGSSLKLGETTQVAASNTLTQNGEGCF